MKKRTRFLSLLMSGVMAASLLPAQLSDIALPAHAEPSDKTDLTIDFDQSAVSADAARINSYWENRTSYAWLQQDYGNISWKPALYWTCNNDPAGWSYWIRNQTNRGGLPNIKTDPITGSISAIISESDARKYFNNHVQPYSLRKLLESEDENDKYIALAADDTHDERNRDEWETIRITKDKVLDLNGHTLEIRYDRNCDNSDNHYQNKKDPSTHKAVAFEITKGATLTIIDSSAWRGEGPDGKGTGKMIFTAYMISPFNYAIYTYTTRDLFHVNNGNLVVYGGTFQAGRKKAQSKSKFSWSKLKATVGTAVELGVNVAEYATGLNVATAEYEDLTNKLNQPVDKDGLKEMAELGMKEQEIPAGLSDTVQRNGKPDGIPPIAPEKKENTPDQKESRNQTIGEKDTDEKTKQGSEADPEDKNKANDKKNAKEEKGKNTQLAEAQNNIINKATDKSKIENIVDSAFGLIGQIADMCGGEDLSSIVTQAIQGTVVKVGNYGSFVSYGGTFQGYGSTPNTRNAVVEVYSAPDSNPMIWDKEKNAGGVAYIYDGTFEAYNGANVFNFVRDKEVQYAHQWVRDENGVRNPNPVKVQLSTYETGGVEVLYYQNQSKLDAGTETVPVPINTSNVQVRGGTFRCFYDIMNVGINDDTSWNPDNKDRFHIFPGTMGSVNLGAESFNTKLIQDGRIQIDDPYGAGALVLMDERSEEEAGNNGLYYYRLFCTDTELRYKSYLNVYPQKSLIGTSRSMQLSTYRSADNGNEETVTKLLFADDGKDNIRAPYRQTEYYFDYKYNNTDAESYFVMPNFYNSQQSKMDVYGEYLSNSEVWYYAEPQKAPGGQIPDPGYSNHYAIYTDKNGNRHEIDDRNYGSEFHNKISRSAAGDVSYFQDSFSAMRRNLHYFTYRIYRVDPLTRENLSESGEYGVDDPLFTVRYGANTDSLKCKLPLKMLEREIKNRRPELNWQGYQDGEMYRIVLNVEEYLDFGDGIGEQSLSPASNETSILFRCYSKTEEADSSTVYNPVLFTPLRWDYNASTKGSTQFVTDFTDLEPITTTQTFKRGDLFDYPVSGTIRRGDGEIISGEITQKTDIDKSKLDRADALKRFSNKFPKKDAIASDSVAQITMLNGKAGMTDCIGHRKVFDLYYQWWEVTKDGKPVRLLAGTDHVYDSSMGSKSMHSPAHWNFNLVKPDGTKYQYCNTVDPLDPNAKNYGSNGLPKVGTEYGVDWEWTDEQIHLYSTQTTKMTRLTKDGTDNLYLGNNKIFETNTDRCYIPQDMAGKYLQVKVIALNNYWPEAFDMKQTFESQIVQVVDSHGELKMQAETKYADGKTYAAYDHPATLSVSQVRTLDEGEVISSVEYYAGVQAGGRNSIVFDNLKITDPSKLPKVKYPDDFYPDLDKEELKKLKSHEVNYQVLIETSKGSQKLRDSFTESQVLRYEVETESLRQRISSEETFKLSEIRSGIYDSGKEIFSYEPKYATVGFCDFAAAKSTDPSVAKLDEQGKLFFGGSSGETEITFKGLKNEDVSLKITVIHDYDCFEISDIKPPVFGEKLDFTSPTVPDDAPYRITDVKWYKGNYDEAGKDETVAYFQPYRIEITVESNEYSKADELSDYILKAEQADGTVETVTGKTWREYVESPDGSGLIPGQKYIIDYTYPALTDHSATVIDKVYMDFPTTVTEGDNFRKWLEDVHIYTNGYNEGFQFTVTPTYGAEAEKIASAYGYGMNNGKQINVFIKGVQTGLAAEIEIPYELKKLGDVFAENVTLYVNGEESKNKLSMGSDRIRLAAPDSLTILDGAAPAVLPAYTMSGTDAVVGETISLRDLLITDDPRVGITLKDVLIYGSNDSAAEYVNYDLKEGIVTPVKAAVFQWSSDELKLVYQIGFDADGDGYPEYQEDRTLSIAKIYADASEVPEKPVTAPKTRNIKVKVLAPDGKTASDGEYLYDGSLAVIPEVENTFIEGIYDADGKQITESAFEDGGSYTVKTVSADSIEIHAGKDSVFAFVRQTDGSNLKDLQISADNAHFTTGDRITGLKPETEYTLYYKQGITGEIYTAKFRTAKQDYGVFVGRVPVTDENTGDLEQDGWHYDPETKTLTLKNLDLKDSGVMAEVDEWSGYSLWSNAVIYAEDDLHVKLTGKNSIDVLSRGLEDAAIRSDKNLTVEGNGSLTITENGNALAVAGLYSKDGDINLNGTGTLQFDGLNYAFDPAAGDVNYKNGTIDFIPETTTIGETTYAIGSLLPDSRKTALDLSGAQHDLDIGISDKGDSYETVAADDLAPESAKYLQIKPEHHDVNKVVSAENHESGICGGDNAYHLSCDCGHIGEESFMIHIEEHSLVKHAAVPATCTTAGSAAYWECELCGERYADANGTKPLNAADLIVPAAGHALVHQEAKEATCTEDGAGEHWACTRCGERFADKDGKVKLAGDTVIPATGHNWIQYYKKHASCTKDGSIEHWECANCGAISADHEGAVLLTADEIKIPAIGHSWSEWTVSKEATDSSEGEEIRICSHCEETETRVIPAKHATTTTTKATTTTAKATTSTTKAATTTTKAATTTTKAATTTTKAATTTTKAATTTTKAATTTTKAATTTTKAATTTTKAATTTTKAATTTTKAATTTTKAAATTTKAAATTTKAATTTTKAATTTTKAATTTTKAATTTTKAATTTTKAATTTTQAATTTTKDTTTTAETTTTSATQDTTSVTSSDTTASTTETTPTVTEPSEPEFLRGDINGDGKIGVDDAQAALIAYTEQFAGNPVDLTDTQRKAVDVNEDGKLNVDDAQNILIYYTERNVAGNDITWEDLLGPKPQPQPRPQPLTLHEDIWMDPDSPVTGAEAS
ncbi:MAG: hypothetical protein IKI77_09250 [Oscillospiraceae bacterium]|nr:hypothetical protein [Oscillospiraceae bacterium]